MVSVLRERLNGCITKQNEIVEAKTGGRVKVTKVEVWEHEGNSAIYEQSTKSVEGESVAEASTESNDSEGPSAPPKQRVTQGMSNPFGGTSWGE